MAAYSPDPDRRPPLPRGWVIGAAGLILATVGAVFVTPLIITAALAALS